MTIRKWFYLFWTTTLLGAMTSIVVGLLLQLTDKEYNQVGIPILLYSVMFMFLGGAMIAVLSQMGFFAYLIIRYIANGIFRKRWIWDYIQIIAFVLVMVDAVYFRRTAFDTSDTWTGYLNYMVMPLSVFICSLVVVYWKVKLTNRSAIIPTLFFMGVVTILEAVPAINLNNSVSSIFMIAPLVVCNAWQILILPKVLSQNKTESGKA